MEELRGHARDDWLIVCGDVSELSADLEWALGVLRERFAKLVWVPGNHDLWSTPADPLQLRGEARYRHLVALCRRLDVLTPRTPTPSGRGRAGPPRWRPSSCSTTTPSEATWPPPRQQALARAHAAGVVCSDELVLHPDPYPSREAWCGARVRESEARLTACAPGLPTVLVNHFPLTRHPTRMLRHPEFAQWCGTVRTADWHVRFGAKAVVYGHLHIPRVTWCDGVRFTEVSLGYPREWRRWGGASAPRRAVCWARRSPRDRGDPAPRGCRGGDP